MVVLRLVAHTHHQTSQCKGAQWQGPTQVAAKIPCVSGTGTPSLLLPLALHPFPTLSLNCRGELPALPFPIGDAASLESPSGWGVRRPLPGISVSPPPPRPPANHHRPPKRSASLQAAPAAPSNGNNSLSFTLIAAAGIPHEPSAPASSRFHPSMQHVRRLSPPATTYNQAPHPPHHHATADGHVHPNPSNSISVRGTHDGRTSLSSSQLPRLVAAAAAAAAGGSGSPAFASPAFAGSIVRPASPDLFAPLALPSLTAKPFQLSKTLLQRMVQHHHQQQGQAQQHHRHRPTGQQTAYTQDSVLYGTGGHASGGSWVLVGDVVPDCGRWVQDPRLPTRDVVMLMAPPHHTTHAQAHVSQARGTAGTPGVSTSLAHPFSGTARTLSAAGQSVYASPFSRPRASASGMGDAYGSGALAIPSSPKLSECGMGSTGGCPASVGCGARSLVLLGVDVGGGAVLALYLTCSMRLAPRVLGAVRDSCSALLRTVGARAGLDTSGSATVCAHARYARSCCCHAVACSLTPRCVSKLLADAGPGGAAQAGLARPAGARVGHAEGGRAGLVRRAAARQPQPQHHPRAAQGAGIRLGPAAAGAAACCHCHQACVLDVCAAVNRPSAPCPVPVLPWRSPFSGWRRVG